MARRRLFPIRASSPVTASWLTTFADLMTLLLCFFVLLLSFSEMDRYKFKVLSGSLKEAFGVQRIRNVWDMPKGLDIIFMNFDEPNFMVDILKERIRSAVLTANLNGNVRIKEDEVSVTVTLPDKFLFDSGQAYLKEEAFPVLDQLKDLVLATKEKVLVVGHTDNVPIHTAQFPSNWELSAARASAVIRYMVEAGGLDAERFTALGKADTEPVAPNDTDENRAKNRRVELVFQKKLDIRSRMVGMKKPALDTEDLFKPESIRPRKRWYW